MLAILAFPVVLFAFGITSVDGIAIDAGAALATAIVALVIESRDSAG
ncbi:MAG TPA: hypothetical protein VH063_05985 [Gaiellaceae bacterium]|nr:hypothetical protein [Gaiellaceae bacterium]